MKLEHKLTAFIILGILFISMASAQLVFQQSTETDIKIVCINAGYCSSASVCNVSVFNPLEETLLSGITATRASNLAFHNFTLNSTQMGELGQYRVGGFCKDGSVTQLIDFTFDVTPTGERLDNAQSILYFILMLGVFFVFFLALWGSIVLPIKNPKGGLDEIVDVSYLKYFKIGLMFLSFALFVWIINLMLTLSNSFNILSQYNGFFIMMFEILRSLIWPLFVVMWITFVILGWRDLQLIKLLTRGINPK